MESTFLLIFYPPPFSLLLHKAASSGALIP